MKITERGWAGHFILSDRCLFRRNTLIEHGKIKIVVSTVGNCRDYHAPDGFNKVVIQDIGINRYFETTCFHADETKWLDADVSRQVYFESDWAISEPWKEAEANLMHETVVKEICAKLKSGVKFKH